MITIHHGLHRLRQRARRPGTPAESHVVHFKLVPTFVIFFQDKHTTNIMPKNGPTPLALTPAVGVKRTIVKRREPSSRIFTVISL